MSHYSKLTAFKRSPREPRGYIVTAKYLPDGQEDQKLLVYANTPLNARHAAMARLKKKGLDLSQTIELKGGKRVGRFHVVLRVPFLPGRIAGNWQLFRAARDFDARF